MGTLTPSPSHTPCMLGRVCWSVYGNIYTHFVFSCPWFFFTRDCSKVLVWQFCFSVRSFRLFFFFFSNFYSSFCFFFFAVTVCASVCVCVWEIFVFACSFCALLVPFPLGTSASSTSKSSSSSSSSRSSFFRSCRCPSLCPLLYVQHCTLFHLVRRSPLSFLFHVALSTYFGLL